MICVQVRAIQRPFAFSRYTWRKQAIMFLRRTFLLLISLKLGELSVIQDLSSNSVKWNLENGNNSISANAVVPGGIFNDLQINGILGDQIFYRFGDTENRWVSKDNWSFRTEFQVSSEILKSKKINIVFDGLNTIADVVLNETPLCGCTNMFTRFVFPVNHILKKDGTANKLVVRFHSTIAYAAEKFKENPTNPACVPPVFQGECHVNMVRTMQASFGWDWGPALPSQGIWKSVYLEGIDIVAIRDVKYFMTQQTQKQEWTVDVTAFLDIAEEIFEEVAVVISLIGNNGKVLKQTEPLKIDNTGDLKITRTFSVPQASVDLWWPNGMNKSQPLYNVTISLMKNNEILASRTNRVGFRTIRLIQEPVVREAPEKGLTFYLQVNGLPIFAKGSNYVPGNIIAEKGTDPKLAEHLLRSAAEAGFNILRVWGGGVYETDYFYGLCDQLGIMIWQDFMFANSLYPIDEDFVTEVKREVRGTVRRLQHHPSIAIWAGNNEMEGAVQGSWWGGGESAKENYTKLFGHIIRDIVHEEDTFTPFVVSSPTNGLKTDEDGFLSKKNTSAWSELFGDTHIYKYNSNEDLMNSSMYIIARFVSEYGYQSFPFLRNWQKETIGEDLANFSSTFISTRQHQSGGTERLFTQTSTILMQPSNVKEYRKASNLEKFIFLTQISQSVGTGIEALKHRRMRDFFNPEKGIGQTMGSMYWQLNDVWAAPSWGGIDHEGKWKMLHYHMAHIFAPVAISVDYERGYDHFSVYAVSDLVQDLYNVELEVIAFTWESLEPLKNKTIQIERLANLSAAVVLSADVVNFLGDPELDFNRTFLTLQLKRETGAILTGVYFHPLQKLSLATFPTMMPTLEIVNVAKRESEIKPHYKAVFDIEISTNGPAPYVWLDAGDIKGRFSDNGFILTKSKLTLQFFALQIVEESELQTNVTIQSYFDAITSLNYN